MFGLHRMTKIVLIWRVVSDRGVFSYRLIIIPIPVTTCPYGQVVTHCAFYIVLGITLNAPPKCHL